MVPSEAVVVWMPSAALLRGWSQGNSPCSRENLTKPWSHGRCASKHLGLRLARRYCCTQRLSLQDGHRDQYSLNREKGNHGHRPTALLTISSHQMLFLCQCCVVKCISLAFKVFLHLCHLWYVLPYSGARPMGQKPNDAHDEAFAFLLRQTICWSCYFIAQFFCKSLFLLISHSLVKGVKYLPSASVLCGRCLMHS